MRGISPSTRMAVTAVFIALVCATTIMFSIYVPATHGYFNIGEAMVYTTALLFGPVIGAIAGGVGSALADAILGYWIYAPATLIIKACEGAVVGFLSRRALKGGATLDWRVFTIIIGIAIASLVGYTGLRLYTGEIEATIGFPSLGLFSFTLNIPPAVWIIISIIAMVAITYIGLSSNPLIGWTVFAMLIGGLLMVAGYFIYEWTLYGAAAIVEIPVNIGQSIIGILVAAPLTQAIWRRIPWIKKSF